MQFLGVRLKVKGQAEPPGSPASSGASSAAEKASIIPRDEPCELSHQLAEAQRQAAAAMAELADARRQLAGGWVMPSTASPPAAQTIPRHSLEVTPLLGEIKLDLKVRQPLH